MHELSIYKSQRPTQLIRPKDLQLHTKAAIAHAEHIHLTLQVAVIRFACIGFQKGLRSLQILQDERQHMSSWALQIALQQL